MTPKKPTYSATSDSSASNRIAGNSAGITLYAPDEVLINNPKELPNSAGELRGLRRQHEAENGGKRGVLGGDMGKVLVAGQNVEIDPRAVEESTTKTKKQKSTPEKISKISKSKKDGRKNSGWAVAKQAKEPVVTRTDYKSPTKLTKDAWKRMHEDMNFDPLEYAVRIAKGEELTQDHPFLARLLDFLGILEKKLATIEVAEGDEKSEKNKQYALMTIEQLQKESEKMLSDNWVSHELRSKHILELLKYIYPQRKSMDHMHSGSVEMDINIKPLTKEEIVIYEQRFDEDY